MTKDRSPSHSLVDAEESPKQIGRRKFLERAAVLMVAAGAAAGGVNNARAADKAAKSDVSYQDSPKDGASCANCKLYNGDGTCQVVEGDISPDGWCIAWVAN